MFHPVDTGVQIADVLVPQLGTVAVVYTGNLLQIPEYNTDLSVLKVIGEINEKYFIKRRLSSLYLILMNIFEEYRNLINNYL